MPDDTFVYGIGNPLIDLIIDVDEEDLTALGLAKGTMHLIDLEERERILRHVSGREITYGCGGSCPNTLITLAALGRKVALAGKIGRDDFGRRYAENLPTEGIVSQLTTGSGTTGSSIILVTPDTERTMNTYLGINREFSAADMDQSVIGRSTHLYFTGYMWDTSLQKEAVLKAIALCKKRGAKVIFDVADPFAVNRNRAEFIDLIDKHADIVFANREEARILFDSDDPAEAARRMTEKCEIAVVKNGAMGSVVRTASGELHEIPVFRVRAVDTTGAGDMYSAGFVYGLTEGWPCRDAGLFATYLASKIVEKRGAQFEPVMRKKLAADSAAGAWRRVEAQ